MRVRAGDVIAGKYEVERVLAAGGMGVVVAANHLHLKRRVALKFLLPELCEVPSITERFLREAQAMTTIQNEHVARVLDVGTTNDGSPYMVMEYLEGEDLGQRLERLGPLALSEAVDFLLQGMEALAEAHVNGFVHRDLKPSNLFVTSRPDGSPLVKVLDFGISKAMVENEKATNLTQTGGMLGSPLYMAPEQIRNSKKVDVRADIWTLGVILHELVTGKSPFEDETDNVAAVLAAIMSDDPPALHTVRTDVPPAFSEVVLRCLNRNREQRYSTVADLADALAPFAPAEARLSVERIRRVVDHHHRTSMNPDLSAKTMAKGTTPVSKPEGWEPRSSPLDKTAPAPPASEPSLRVAAPARTPPSRRDDPSPVPSGRPSGHPADSTFGKYRLLAILGQGGMADVFLAVLDGPEGFGFSKLVVIKRLRPGLANDPEFVSMLVDEARIAARVNHPNVVQTHEVGVIDGDHYIAMEYLEGQPLSQIVQRATSGGEAMPLGFRLGVVRDLLAGLHHAHELADFDGKPLGLVHRDVTPQNVFVTYDGQVKVVDFGIAKARGRATETQQGTLKGKVRYMSPEQAGGQEIDRRTDVFGAGVVLWELLTGERMWKDQDDVAIIQKLLLDKIASSPRSVNPDVPKALDAIVKKALSRKKTDRYASAQELQLDIERFMETEGLKCPPRELGSYVESMFADRRRQARLVVEEQLSKLNSEGGSHLRVVKLPSSGASTPSGAGAGSTGPRLDRLDRDAVPEENVSRPAALSRTDPSRTGTTGASARPRWAVLGGAALVVVTVVVGLLVRTRGEGGSGTTGRTDPTGLVMPPPSVHGAEPLPSTPSASATTPAPSTANVHVSLMASAPGAEFAIDGEPKTKAPVVLTKPRDGKPHRITASAPGYRAETKTFTFDEDVLWAPQLVSEKGQPRVSTSSAAAPIVSASAAVPAPVLSASSSRPRRELDPDSPYAKQPAPQ